MILSQQPPTELSRADIAASAKVLFAPERGWRARLQRWRPSICPFERLLPWISPHVTVLDIGCGAGLLLGLLARSNRVSRGVGLDSDGRALQWAARMASRLPDNPLEFVHVADTHTWPMTTFDVVLLVDVLHHVAPAAQEQFLRAALTRVRPGGRFIYKDMAAKPVWYAMANRAHDLMLARQWIHYISTARVRAVLDDEGFTLRRQEHVRLKWYAHDLLVFDRPEPS